VLSLINRHGAEQDGFLWANEVYNLRLPVEMVVLSGCRTGLGKEIKGEGLVGLTRGFMYAGSKRVLMSLWDISDEASAELMAHLYRAMLKEHMSPAAALRAAQIQTMKDSRWRAPYYWAAFVLQGEPR
jgi:CHAT domain-containing protein